MALPVPPNVTCDVYHAGTNPPAAPAVAGVPCFLHADFRGGVAGAGAAAATAAQAVWTHVLLVDKAVDVRDAYTGSLVFTAGSDIYVPDQTGTRFRVVFVERIGIGTAQEHKRVYLDRGQPPSWPSNNL